MNLRTPVLVLAAALFALTASARRVVRLADYGIRPDTRENMSPLMERALARIRAELAPGEKATLLLEPGRYDFRPEGAARREYYVSNHDQPNPKCVGIALEEWHGLTFDGRGAELVFHGRMLPLALVRSTGCTLRDLTIDFAEPHIAQIRIAENTPAGGIVFEPEPWVDYELTERGFEPRGEGWSNLPGTGIAFDGGSGHMLYRTSDLLFSTHGAHEVAPRRIAAPEWRDARLVPGTRIAMRTWERPAPGIFLDADRNTELHGVTVHYAEGMGLLAQVCENITLDGFRVCLREGSGRCFTTQADATHFSGCRGRIVSCGGLYENMMDDAINVHGTYLRITRRIDGRTVEADYMHPQSWGFFWGEAGDEVQFVRSATMDLAGARNRIASITPCDAPTAHGAKRFRILFEEPLDPAIGADEGFGIENLTWSPEVLFRGNVVRNNRARGALFSTPRRVTVEENLFDHTSGTAVLLCGDCNGWYETGACREVRIRRNRFVNALTNMFQFTEAVISICPEIPDLDAQERFFHGGRARSIVIRRNRFETFDKPVLYGRSVDGVRFRRNAIVSNDDFPAFHPNGSRFVFRRARRVDLRRNTASDGDLSVDAR